MSQKHQHYPDYILIILTSQNITHQFAVHSVHYGNYHSPFRLNFLTPEFFAFNFQLNNNELLLLIYLSLFLYHCQFSQFEWTNEPSAILFTEKTRLVQSQGFKGKGRGWGRRVNPLIYTKKNLNLNLHTRTKMPSKTHRRIFFNLFIFCM